MVGVQARCVGKPRLEESARHGADVDIARGVYAPIDAAPAQEKSNL
jgi:hypothetical protein